LLFLGSERKIHHTTFLKSMKHRFLIHSLNHTALVVDITQFGLPTKVFPPGGEHETAPAIRFQVSLSAIAEARQRPVELSEVLDVICRPTIRSFRLAVVPSQIRTHHVKVEGEEGGSVTVEWTFNSILRMEPFRW
jgi:hypothetical protein